MLTLKKYFLLVYHIMFQLTMAMATGALFVAATRRYYQADSAAKAGYNSFI